MKTIALSIVLLVISQFGFSQEGLKGSINAGVPLGGLTKDYLINVQGNVDYLFHITREIHVGFTAGYSRFIKKNRANYDMEDISYIPIGGTIQFHLNNIIKVGGDVGYGVVLTPENTDGNFYFAPEIYYTLSDITAFILGYRSLAIDGDSIDAITVGFELGLL